MTAENRRLFEARRIDALRLEFEPNFTPYGNEVVERLVQDGLIESAPFDGGYDGPTGGVLISAARLRHELEDAFNAGYHEATTRVVEQ